MSRIDDAVTRILRVKFAMGLMEPGKSFKIDQTFLDAFGGASHRAVARQAVRESLVAAEERAQRAAACADREAHPRGGRERERSRQPVRRLDDPVAGPERVAHRGHDGARGDPAARRTQRESHLLADGTGADGADVAVVVVGETPYAEMMGDRRDLALSESDMATIANAKKAGIPVVVVLFSGRPLIINDALAQADAFVAAWLPGTEGLGVATCCSATTSRRASCRSAGRGRWRRSRSTSATPRTTRCSRMDLV